MTTSKETLPISQVKQQEKGLSREQQGREFLDSCRQWHGRLVEILTCPQWTRVYSFSFQCYVPADTFASFFGRHQAFGVLMAATIGVPLYVCGGGTIPLLMEWLQNGMSMGAAAAFMITGPATKITNLGAVKIVLGIKRFILYLLFTILFAIVTGLITNMFLRV